MHASMLAMRRAVARLGLAPDLALVDGNYPPKLGCAVRCVIGGDALCLSIAAASIVAKVVRDRAMARLAVRFPGYGWHANAGYATAATVRPSGGSVPPIITGGVRDRRTTATGVNDCGLTRLRPGRHDNAAVMIRQRY